MKNIITIGLPSKGRLKEDSISFFEKNNLKPTSNGGERNYFAQIENLPNSIIPIGSSRFITLLLSYHLPLDQWYYNFENLYDLAILQIFLLYRS